MTLDLARRGHEVVALDSDPVLLAALRARAGGLAVEAVVADARGFALARRFALSSCRCRRSSCWAAPRAGARSCAAPARTCARRRRWRWRSPTPLDASTSRRAPSSPARRRASSTASMYTSQPWRMRRRRRRAGDRAHARGRGSRRRAQREPTTSCALAHVNAEQLEAEGARRRLDGAPARRSIPADRRARRHDGGDARCLNRGCASARCTRS